MFTRYRPAGMLRLLIGLSIVLAGLSILLSRLLLPARPDLMPIALVALAGAAFLTAQQLRRTGDKAPAPPAFPR